VAEAKICTASRRERPCTPVHSRQLPRTSLPAGGPPCTRRDLRMHGVEARAPVHSREPSACRREAPIAPGMGSGRSQNMHGVEARAPVHSGALAATSANFAASRRTPLHKARLKNARRRGESARALLGALRVQARSSDSIRHGKWPKPKYARRRGESARALRCTRGNFRDFRRQQADPPAQGET